MAEGYYVLSEDERRKFAGVVSKIWTDEAFAERWQAEPFAILAEYQIEYPEGFPPPLVPEKPSGDLSLESLEAVAAGSEAEGTAGTAGSLSSFSCPAGTAACAGTYGTSDAQA
jgi:hypothetical protein